MSRLPRPGDAVRCERQAPACGSWSRYAGRTGTVTSVNRQRFENGAPDYVEYGVDLTSEGKATAWFRADELVLVPAPHRAVKAPQGLARTVEV